jgi:hypothetical protein
MKQAFYIRTPFVIALLFASFLTCMGREEPSDLLAGKWTRVMNGRTCTLILTSDNKFQVEFVGDAESDVWGSYVISGEQITFNDEGGQYGSGEAGSYQFQVNEKSLTFTKENDPVYGRSVLVEGTWSKAGAGE